MIWTCKHTLERIENPTGYTHISVWHSRPIDADYDSDHFFLIKKEELARWILTGWSLVWEDEI